MTILYKVSYKQIMQNGEEQDKTTVVCEPYETNSLDDSGNVRWTSEEISAFERYRMIENSDIKNVVVQSIEKVRLLDDNDDPVKVTFGELA